MAGTDDRPGDEDEDEDEGDRDGGDTVAVAAAAADAPSSSSAPVVPSHLRAQQPLREFGLEEMFARVLLPANAAARSLGVSETTFKLRCARARRRRRRDDDATIERRRSPPSRRSIGRSAVSSPGKFGRSDTWPVVTHRSGGVDVRDF